jgi:hypothetical protein
LQVKFLFQITCNHNRFAILVKEGTLRRDLILGQQHRFRSGQKAPNNGIYVEVGETGSMVKNPQKIKLQAGDRFPETSNDDRHWTYQRKP